MLIIPVSIYSRNEATNRKHWFSRKNSNHECVVGVRATPRTTTPPESLLSVIVLKHGSTCYRLLQSLYACSTWNFLVGRHKIVQLECKIDKIIYFLRLCVCLYIMFTYSWEINNNKIITNNYINLKSCKQESCWYFRYRAIDVSEIQSYPECSHFRFFNLCLSTVVALDCYLLVRPAGIWAASLKDQNVDSVHFKDVNSLSTLPKPFHFNSRMRGRVTFYGSLCKQ